MLWIISDQIFKPFSVVTGCTRGIGQAYVDELAKRKMDIILIGRSLPALKEMAANVGEIFSSF
jgi:17beta-estradiol 17-dehydrogenase / very-long-chain 3-oxoacyl-CoA reductase